jgi:selenocysteine-specific elongation factor
MIDAIIESADVVGEADGFVRSVDFNNELPPEVADRWSDVKEDLERSFDVPRMSAIDLEDEVVHALIRNGELVQVGADLVFTSNQIDEVRTRIADLPDGFSVSRFRDEFGMTRRQAVPILEWLDKSGVTKRSGDGRVVRRRS